MYVLHYIMSSVCDYIAPLYPGILAYRAYERCAQAHAARLTRLTDPAVYAGFFRAPFLLCVIRPDFERWKPGYDV